MHAYVINLARSRERRIHIANELSRVRIDYEFVEGIDGRDLDIHDSRVIDSAVLGTRWFRPGVAGCALSHLKVYRKIVEDGLAHALVLEDDIRLPVGLNGLAENLAHYMTGAEVVLLNYDSTHVIRMSREGAVQLPYGRELLLPLNVHQPRSAAAYIITRAACERLIDCATPFRARPDDWGLLYSNMALDRVRCVAAMPVTKDPRFESTIDYNAQRSIKSRLLNFAQQYDVKLAKRIIAHRRERIWRSQVKVEVVDMPFVERPSRLLQGRRTIE